MGTYLFYPFQNHSIKKEERWGSYGKKGYCKRVIYSCWNGNRCRTSSLWVFMDEWIYLFSTLYVHRLFLSCLATYWRIPQSQPGIYRHFCFVWRRVCHLSFHHKSDPKILFVFFIFHRLCVSLFRIVPTSLVSKGKRRRAPIRRLFFLAYNGYFFNSSPKDSISSSLVS